MPCRLPTLFCALLLVGCVHRAPLSDARWQESLAARPQVTRGVEVRSATPSEPGTLYERTDERTRAGALDGGMLVCRVALIGALDPFEPTPDRIVELAFGDRTSVFHRPDARRWDFSLGLVDLEPGEAVSLRVTDDALGRNHVVLQGTERYDGSPLRWTERYLGVRTSVRCRIPEPEDLERELARRLRSRKLATRPRSVAAIVGWADPRVGPAAE